MFHITNRKREYIDYVLNHQLDKSKFTEIIQENHNFKPNDVKLIAHYLPQFHDFKENIKWFGRGFSEWSNTSKTVPQFIGHYQPHIPIDVGYYNLENINIMKRQIELAKKYGIYGFSFYYYWFSGEKIMEKPLEKFLADKSLDIPFLLFWANEDWTMLWSNGQNRETLHKQELLDGDAEKFMQDALPYFKDKRYIKIGNKPILIIYNPGKFPYEKYKEFNLRIRKIAKENGFDDLYILTTTFRAKKYKSKTYTDKFLLDGLFEFFPQGLTSKKIINPLKVKIMNNKFNGKIFNITKWIDKKRYIYPYKANLFKGCFPSWDNTSRKCYNGANIFPNTPEHYKKWLKDIISWTIENKSKDEQFLFINAWNEWAEGAHLEPDQKYGYSYLQMTKEALEELT